MNVEVNFVAVLAAGIAAMVLGFLWYGPILGKVWMKEKGIKPEDVTDAAKKEMNKWYAVTFVLSLVTAYVLSHVIALSLNFYNYSEIQTGLLSAFWMWIGFVMPIQAGAVIFGALKKNWKVFAIDTTYQLVSLFVMGVVLASL